MRNEIQIIKPLTSFRFIFALMVFFSHLKFLKNSNSETLNWLYTNIFKEGFVGVGFFFVLSGFILAYNYESLFFNKSIDKTTFYINRISRIYPVHVLTFLVAIPLTISTLNQSLNLWLLQAMTNFSLTQSFFPYPEIFLSFNTPSWSISSEMFFYFSFPFIILFGKWFNNRFFILALLVFIPFLAFISPEKYYTLFYINPFLRIIDFIIGILLYRLFTFLKTKEYNFDYNLLEIGSVLLFIAFFVFHHWVPIVARCSFYYWIPICFVLLSFSFQKGILSGILSHKKLIYLGEISFSFYMIHWIVISYFQKSLFYGIQNDYTIVLISFFVSLLLSHFCFKYYETPIGKWMKSKLKKR